MPGFTIYALDASQITISNGRSLSGINQGNGSQLNGQTITLNSNAWTPINITDSNDNLFEDSDSSQTLNGTQTFGTTSYGSGLRVEAEYRVTVQDPNGVLYTLYGFNINEVGAANTYGTTEGLAFVGPPGGFPPIDTLLTVTNTAEGGAGGAPNYSQLATPPCFTPGTLIDTPGGPRAIETLAIGDQVTTLDHGPQPIRWIGRVHIDAAQLDQNPHLRPIKIARAAFGPAKPARDMLVSPQHRILIDDWRADYYFSQPEILVPAKFFTDGRTATQVNPPEGIDYIHLLFDSHEILISDGLPSESFQPGPQVLDTMADATKSELLALFPTLASDWTALPDARHSVTKRESAVLRAP